MSEWNGDFDCPVIDLPPSVTTSAESVVRFLVAKLVDLGRLRAENADRVVCQVLHRESLGSTGIGRGVALPHSKSDVIGESLAIAGKSNVPVNWPGALDSMAVHLIYLLLTPASDPAASVRALERMSRKLRGV
jgi:PTS system fructose-specific IIA component/PTS system nitrogen regulatory IIA component